MAKTKVSKKRAPRVRVDPAQELADAQAASDALPSVPEPHDEELVLEHHAAVIAEKREVLQRNFERDRKILDRRLAAARKRMASA